MKIQLASRPKCTMFDISAGETFILDGKVFLALAPGRLLGNQPFNAANIATGSLFNIAFETEVERLRGTLVEEDIEAPEIEL